jgi:hypothetical protein
MNQIYTIFYGQYLIKQYPLGGNRHSYNNTNEGDKMCCFRTVRYKYP